MKLEFTSEQIEEAILALRYGLAHKDWNNTPIGAQHVLHELEFALSVQQIKPDQKQTAIR